MKKILIYLLIFIACSEKEENVYQINTTASEGGSVVNENTLVKEGEKATIRAVPSVGYVFKNWTGNISSTENPLTVEIFSNQNIIANFELNSRSVSENVPVLVDELVDDSEYIFAIKNGGKQAFALNREGTEIKSWNFENSLGNDVELLSDGSMIGMFRPLGVIPFSFGGFGGLIRKLDAEGTVTWEMTLANENEIMHHDVELLPNGNLITIVWERITVAEAMTKGVVVTSDIFLEKIIEINMNTNQIVWQWRSWDHIIQNETQGVATFMDPVENRNKINVNYSKKENGDRMHANGLFYDPNNDVILLSVNFYSEVWVIDHSTSTEEATSSSGGNFNKGGDLIYRFGNPQAYGGDGERLFDNNHFPNIIPAGRKGEGNVMVYSNGTSKEQSTIYELKLPNYTSALDIEILPEVVWSFSNEKLFFDKISGAFRLKNGNTLICEGDYGYWEVTPQKEVVWKYTLPNTNFWRGYSYPKSWF